MLWYILENGKKIIIEKWRLEKHTFEIIKTNPTISTAIFSQPSELFITSPRPLVSKEMILEELH